MPNNFILIEGTDGSGKATQVELLRLALKRKGYKVAIIDFPHIINHQLIL